MAAIAQRRDVRLVGDLMRQPPMAGQVTRDVQDVDPGEAPLGQRRDAVEQMVPPAAAARHIVAHDIAGAKRFYHEILGLDLLMDMGWIQTYGSKATMSVQMSVATEGGSGTPVPDLSIEVDDLDEALSRFKNAGIALEYGPQTEPWGVRRFFVRDPFGKLLNILQHE